MINICLTAKMYHSVMVKYGFNNQPTYTGKRASIWFALALAMLLHAMLLLLAIERPDGQVSETGSHVEIVLEAKPATRNEPEPVSLPEPVEVPGPMEMPEPEESTIPEQAPVVAQSPLEAPPVEETPLPLLPVQRKTFEQMTEDDRQVLVSSLLSQQYFREKPLTEQLFGKPINKAGPQAEFHLPYRADMISMLDKPMPDLPFAYQEGLIYFAYDPGVKGDLQRFWDVITPEFGWRTRYGTEVRCIWVLVVMGCGWK
jgi:hypothetical protein